MIITIDGPTASGKSSVARALAKELGFYYLYSGLLFRGLAYVLLKKGYSLDSLAQPSMPDVVSVMDPAHFEYRYDQRNHEQIIVQGENITPYLKSGMIDQAASIVSAHPEVRALMARVQHQIASSADIIVDGRDSGSVVFAHADIKFFLTASLTVRAQRWCRQQEKQGNHYTQQEAEAFIATRDNRDAARDCAPLIIPLGARVIDTSALTIAQAVGLMRNQIDMLHHS